MLLGGQQGLNYSLSWEGYYLKPGVSFLRTGEAHWRIPIGPVVLWVCISLTEECLVDIRAIDDPVPQRLCAVLPASSELCGWPLTEKWEVSLAISVFWGGIPCVSPNISKFYPAIKIQKTPLDCLFAWLCVLGKCDHQSQWLLWRWATYNM